MLYRILLKESMQCRGSLVQTSGPGCFQLYIPSLGQSVESTLYLFRLQTQHSMTEIICKDMG